MKVILLPKPVTVVIPASTKQGIEILVQENPKEHPVEVWHLDWDSLEIVRQKYAGEENAGLPG